MLPNHSKNIQIEFIDKHGFGEKLIGTGLIPFNTFKYLDDLPPTWINVYGPPLSGIGKKAEEMAIFGAKRGSCYRGRVLLRMSSRDHDNPISRTVKMTYKPPEMLVPTPPSKTYTLRIDVYSGQELPGDSGMLHFTLGPYLLKTASVYKKNGKIVWDETVEMSRLVLPIDATMIPDLVVYFADKDYESHRKCFFRVKAIKILARSRKRYDTDKVNPQIVKLKEDSTLDLVEDDQFSGFVTIRPVLFSYKPPPKMDFTQLRQSSNQKKYILRVFTYVARRLPSADDGGIANPFIAVRCSGKTMVTRTKRRTLNPEWYETLTTEIEIPSAKDVNAPNPTLVVLVYHSDDGRDFTAADLENKRRKKVLLGRYWLNLDIDIKKKFKGLSETIDIIYKKPKWVPIVYDKSDVSEGKLMMSYSMVPKEKDYVITEMIASKGIDSIEPEYKNIDMSLFTIGVRNIISHIGFYTPYSCSCEIKLSRDLEELESDPSKINSKPFNKPGKAEDIQISEGASVNRTTNRMLHSESTLKKGDELRPDGTLRIGQIKVVNRGITFNRTFRFRVKAPYNPEVCPVLEVFLFHHPLGKKRLLGAAAFELREVLGFFYGEEDDSDYKARWTNFFSTAISNRMEGTKVKPPKFKLPKVRPENRLLYMDDLVYKLPTKIKSKKRQKRDLWKEEHKKQAVMNRLDKWANETSTQNNKLSYIEEEITPEDLIGLNDDEKEMIKKEYGIVEDEDFKYGIKKKSFAKKMSLQN